MRSVATSFFSMLALFGMPAHAEPKKPVADGLDLSAGTARTPAPSEGTYVHGFGELMLGKGLRLNDPFRLGSTTATYLDLGAGVAFGPVRGLQHGGEVSLSIATDGIAQEVVSLSYVALWPVAAQAILRARGGLPIVVEPDTSVGLELAVGGVWLVTGGFGLSAELVGSLFYGAATFDESKTSAPLVALELGAWFDYEALP